MTQVITPHEPQEHAQEVDGQGPPPFHRGQEHEEAKPGRVRARVRSPWLALAGLVVLGGVSGVAYYLGFVKPYLLSEYYARPLLDLAKINGYTAGAANAWGFTWALLFACYYAAFRLCPPSGASRIFRAAALALIVGWAAFFTANLLFMYPVGAADLFDQIFRARLTAQYGYNPFTTLPSSVVGDPFQQYVAWKGDPSPYGPVWETLAAGVSLLAGNSLWGNLIGFKLLVVGAYAISTGLTYAIMRMVKPEWALKGALFFAWNPLVLFEVAGNGHNDAVVVMFLLLAVLLLVAGRRTAVLPALTAGALTKFVPVLLVPAAVAAIWKDGGRARSRLDSLRELAFGAVLSLGLALVVYAPFWTGPESILPRNRGTLFTASIPKVVLDWMVADLKFSENTAQWLVRNTAYAIVAAVSVALAIWVLNTPRTDTPDGRSLLFRRTLIAFYEVIFAYLLVASLWFQPWYLLWLVALTAPVTSLTHAHRTILFCIGGVLNYFVWDFIWLWNRTDMRTNQITSALAVYTLPVLYTLYVWTVGRRADGERGVTTDD